jgi:hypothetical protein
MKMRILSIACVATAGALLVACTTVYKNSDACEQLMRSKLADTTSDTLKIAHTGAGIGGSRVVVEGSIEHVQTAAEVAASEAEVASAAAAASAASAASGARASRRAPGMRSASAALAASAARASDASGNLAALDDSGASGSLAASDELGASASLAASGADGVMPKPAKPKKLTTAAAAECTFNGSVLDVFSWLAPKKLAAPADDAASEAATE